MRILVIAATLLVALVSPALAQRPSTYEQLTVSTSAVSIASSTLSGMATCTAVLETAGIRWRNDGTAPTANIGTPLTSGTAIVFANISDARLAQFIRSGATDGVLHVNCFPAAGEVQVTGSGSGGSSSLPADAATETEQETQTVHLAAIETAVEAVQANMAPDAVKGNAASLYSTGPWVMGHASSTAPTAVTTGQMQGAWFNLNGASASFPVANTIGGCTPGSSISSGAVLETEIKGSAGQLYYLVITNIDTTPVYARLYNDTAANTDETDTPNQRFVVPSAGSANGAGFVLPIAVGAYYDTAITLRVTTTASDTGTGALTANEVFVSYCYK